MYRIQRALRPTRLSGSKAFLSVVTNADSVFEWKCMDVQQTYDFLCVIMVAGKPLNYEPVRSCHLRGNGQMFLVQPIILGPMSEIRIMVANCLAPDRKWNKVGFTFIGEKMRHE